MRANYPVSGREYPFPSGQTLVSTTDTKGRILYCNSTFIEVSGYSREELLGQPHNLIRHPDMPEEAFRDMWETIASGRPWSAPVKNRRKNGDHYWVMANATPLLENGRPVAYMSVRTEPTREQIEAAEKLYATMREEKSAGNLIHMFCGGRLVKRTPLGRLAEFSRLNLSDKLFLTLLGMLLVGSFARALLPGGLAGSYLVYAAQIGVLLGLWAYLRQLVVLPLDGIIHAANRMAAGDLTESLRRTRTDLLGELEVALSQLSVNLRSIVRDARDQSGAMALSTAEIAQGNLDLSQRTESQASNLEETAASMEEITGTVRQSAEAAKQASRLSAQASGISLKGSEAVNDLAVTMKAIQESSGRIGEITQVIDSIAFQTNILALNAAVEAARAGEQGKGFAVVASEVRALAQRTSTAAKEIKALIEESAAKVTAGFTKAEGARKTIDETVASVQRVSTLVEEISHAASEQLAGISQVNTAITELDTITQQNAALVEEIAASAHSLEGLAKETTETVAVFRLDAKGNAMASVDAVQLRRAMRTQTSGAVPRAVAKAA